MPARHQLHFHENEADYSRLLLAWLAEGLGAGHTCLVIATARHRALLEAQMAAAGLGTAAGDYVAHDAETTLDQIMIDGWPDAGRFREVLQRMLGDVPPVRRARAWLFGEMVAVLVLQGRADAAIALEELWNDMIAVEKFSVLCSYPVSAFKEKGNVGHLEAICALHDGVCLP